MLENLFNYSAGMLKKNTIVKFVSMTEVTNNKVCSLLFNYKFDLYYKNEIYTFKHSILDRSITTNDFINYYELPNSYNESRSVKIIYRLSLLNFDDKFVTLSEQNKYHELKYTDTLTNQMEYEFINSKPYEFLIIYNSITKEMYKIFRSREDNNYKFLVMRLKVE